MSRVCLAANTIGYPEGGGHLWEYLNWALGLRSVGCDVVWLEEVPYGWQTDHLREAVGQLRGNLEPYGLADSVALCPATGEPVDAGEVGCSDLEAAAAGTDLLLNLRYDLTGEVVGAFRRTVLVDIDPGLLQIWLGKGWIRIPRHDVYLTVGETVGRAEARFPDAGLPWQHVSRPVALDWWQPERPAENAAFTTVTHWEDEREWIEDGNGGYRNDKRSGFAPFVDLPRHTAAPLELAIDVGENEEDRAMLEGSGWRLRNPADVASTPWDFHRYVTASLGEFTCVKPSCVKLENAWIGSRTLSYLASGKPAVVQHTGTSAVLPDREGLLRFRTFEEAVDCLDRATAEPERQGRLARALVEEHFDARVVLRRVLELALA